MARAGGGAAGHRAVVGLAVAVAAGLGLWGIGRDSLWLDEGYSVQFASVAWGRFVELTVTSQANMSLYYVLLRGWLALGDSEAVIRGLSALFAVAAVPVTGLLGRRLVGPGAGALAALLLAVNAFAVRYAQEARGYSLVMFLVAAATLALGGAVATNGRGRWATWAVLSGLACYAHLFALLVTAAHVGSLALVEPGRRRRALGACALWLLLVAPMAVFLLTRDANPIGWISRPGPGDLQRALVRLSGGAAPWLPLLYAGLAATGLVSLWRRPPALQGARPRWAAALLAGWLAVPVGGSFAISQLSPMFVDRYLIVSLPALVLLAGTGLARLRPRPVAAVALAAVLLLALAGVRAYYRDGKEDWRAVAAFMASRARPGDGVVVFPPKVRAPLEYYLARSERARTRLDPLYPPGTWGSFRVVRGQPKGLAARLARSAGAHGRVWLVSAYGNPARRRAVVETLAESGELLAARAFGRIRVHLFDPATGRAALGGGPTARSRALTGGGRSGAGLKPASWSRRSSAAPPRRSGRTTGAPGEARGPVTR